MKSIRLTPCAAAVALAVLQMSNPAYAVDCTLTTNGPWQNPGDWSCNTRPGSNDNATINVSGLVTVNQAEQISRLNNAGTIAIQGGGSLTLFGGGSTNTGTITIGGATGASLVLANDLGNTGGLLSIASNGTVSQSGSRITGGTITTTGTGVLAANGSGGNILDGVTLNGTLDLASSQGVERVVNGLTLGNAAINVNSNSVLSFQGDQTIGGTGTITLGSTGSSNRIDVEAGNLVLGAGVTLHGQNGTIGGQDFAGGGASLVNNGRISADVSGGTIAYGINGLTTNNNVMEAKNGGTLQINSAVTNGAAGSINVAADSLIVQNGVTVTGGTIATTGNGAYRASGSSANFLNGVTLNGNLDLSSGQSAERIGGSLTLASGSTINVNSNSVLSLQGSSLVGSGTLIFGATGSSNRLDIDAGDAVIGANVVVRGQNGTIGVQDFAGGGASLTNNGRISADVANGTITIGVNGTVTNNGTLEAQNGGTLILNNSIVGSTGSHIDVGTGSTIVQNGVTLQGVINSAGGGNFKPSNSGANFFNGVTFTGTLDLAGSQGAERVVNNLTLNGGINVNSNSVLSFEGNNTLSGTGIVTLGSTGSSNRVDIGAGNLVLGSGVTIHGQNGTIGGQTFLAGGSTLTNNGRISADVATGQIELRVNGLTTNNGVLEAQNGGLLILSSNIAGGAGGSINAGANSVVLQNGITVSGTINTTGSGDFQANNSSANVFDGGKLNGTLDLATHQGSERIFNGLTLNGAVNVNANSVLSFQGDQTVTGPGTIVLGATGNGNRIDIEAGNLTLGSNVTIRGQSGTIGGQDYAGGGSTLTNNGRISADVAGGQVELRVNGSTTNNGILEAQNGGRLVLSSNIAGGAAGAINAGANSVVLQNGITLSGVINTSGTGSFQATASGANILDGVSFNGNLDLASSQSSERVFNNLALNGTINVNANSVLSFQGDQTVTGPGTIVLGSTGNGNRIDIEAGNLTLGSNVTIRGQTGTIGGQDYAGGGSTLTNNGRIAADVAGGQIELRVNGPTTNNNVLEAKNGGTLLLSSAVTNGSAGTISATGADSRVVQNAVTITGGTIGTSGGGVLAATSSSGNFLSGVTLAGTIDLASSQSAERITNGLALSNGSINVNSNSVLSFGGDQTITGTGTITLGATGSGNRIDVEAGNLTFGPGVTIHGQNGTIGGQDFTGGGASLTNNGTIVADVAGGLITIGINGSLANNGTLGAANGAQLTVNNALTGTGIVRSDSGGTVVLNQSSATGQLLNNANLALGTNNLTVSSDYNNANFGTGNGFNKRAGVTGTGAINASGNVAQAITGTNVTNGSTASPTLTIGNVRVGGTTYNYQVANTGTTGPSIRGAIETSINGGSITDPHLTVTPTNYGPVAVGTSSGNLGVTYTASQSGLLTLAGPQTIHVANNFDNVAEQTLNIALANGAAAYNVAVGAATPTPIAFGNVRVNSADTQALTVRNTQVASNFSEDLNATFGASTGNATGTGSITHLVAGGANSAAMTASLNTTTAGAKSGTVTLNYATSGTVNGVSNGLDPMAVGTQTIALSGNVYNTAVGSTTPTPVMVANQRVGGSNGATLTVSNTAAAGAFSEALNASVGASTGGATGSGSVSNLAAGASNGSALKAGVNTTTSGAKTGTITVGYQSDGTGPNGNSGLAAIAAGSQTINVSGNVYSVAAGNIVTAPLNFGTVQVGQVVSRQLAIQNTGTGAAGFVEDLNARFGATSGTNANKITGSGSISNLAAGATSNGLTVGVNTSSAGTVNGSIAVNYFTAGTVGGVSNGLGEAAVGSQAYGVQGTIMTTSNVVDQASPLVNTPQPIALGNVRIGAASPTSAVSVTNQATGNQQAALNATISGNAPITASGSFNQLAPGATNATSLQVGLDTTTAGAKNGTATIQFVSDASNVGGCGSACAMSIGSQDVNVTGAVYRLANPMLVTPAITVAARVGGTASAAIAITNASQDVYTEGLTATRGATAAGFTSAGSVTNLAAGGTSNAITVGLNTTTAGTFTGTQALNLVSTGAGTTGAADLALAGQSVGLTGKVYTAAAAQSTPSVSFGIVHVGDANVAKGVAVTNSAPVSALNDVLTAQAIGTSGAPFSASGSLGAGLAAGQTNAAGLQVGLNTTTAGVYSGTASFSAASHDTDLTDLALNDLAVGLTGTVNNYATDTFSKTSGSGAFSQSGTTFVLDYGTVAQNSGTLSTALVASNAAEGPADVLSGTFSFVDPADFNEAGFSGFMDLIAGASTGPLTFSFDTSTVGNFIDTIVLHGVGSNASGYEASIADITLQIRGSVTGQVVTPPSDVPEPDTIVLLGLGVPLIFLRRTRKGARAVAR